MEYTVTQNPVNPEKWCVEAIDHEHEGHVYLTTFTGPHAQERAWVYAISLNGRERLGEECIPVLHLREGDTLLMAGGMIPLEQQRFIVEKYKIDIVHTRPGAIDLAILRTKKDT